MEAPKERSACRGKTVQISQESVRRLAEKLTLSDGKAKELRHLKEQIETERHKHVLIVGPRVS